MSKSRDGKESEYYKGIIRHQKAEIKRLKRLVRGLEKQSLLLSPEESEELVEELVEKKDCPKCEEGNFNTFEIHGRAFLVCEKCKYRVKV